MTKKVVLILSIIIILFYLITEHTAHLYGVTPYILFGVFIFLHLFMHSGHEGHKKTKNGGHHG